MQSPISSTPVSSWVLTRSHGMHSPPIPAPAVVPTTNSSSFPSSSRSSSSVVARVEVVWGVGGAARS